MGHPKTENIVTCALCGGGHLSRRTEIDRFPYGIGAEPVILEVAVEVLHCEDCQFEFTGPAAEEARHETVCRHLGA